MNRMFSTAFTMILGVTTAGAGFFACSSMGAATADAGAGDGGPGGDGNSASADGGGADGGVLHKSGVINIGQGGVPLSSAYSSILSCKFNATDGVGTVPASLLAHLEKAGDPGISGVYVIGVDNESPVFMVGDIPTTFTVSGGSRVGMVTVSN